MSLGEFLTQTSERGRSMFRALRTNFFWDPDSTDTLPAALQRWASERPQDPYLSFEDRRWTIGSFDAEVNRHARAWRELGVEPGEVVAISLANRPAYLFHFYALGKLGAIASLINPALEGRALRHALQACAPVAILVGDGELDTLAKLELDDLPVGPKRVFVDIEDEYGREPPDLGRFEPWNPHVSGISPLLIPQADLQALDDVAAYIYTSGTTGLPKPAVVKHHRLRRAGDVFSGVARLSSDDCVYVCLPLYHANATAIGVPTTIAARCRLALARKFSASRFWSDCSRHDATVSMYIGELCRYLYNTAPGPDDTRHQVRCFVGNGLRPDIWQPFVDRFGIERVCEFYAATEGNAETVNLLNLEGTVGPILPWKMKLVRWDHEREAMVRGPEGFAIVAKAGEPGVLIGKIDERNPYAGYTQKRASERKVLRDVFEPGDAWFDTGDLLERDRLWHLHFVDRLGDTFRWKGENVSTQEVAETLNRCEGVLESTVYGVEVQGAEGRAGMAAIVVDASFSIERFYAHVADTLPSYAAPRFVRIEQALATTGTFKHQKGELRDAGWDPDKVGGAVLIRDPATRRYVELTPERVERVRASDWPL